MLMKIGRGGPDEVPEGPNELFAKTATRGPSLFSNRNAKMSIDVAWRSIIWSNLVKMIIFGFR